MIDVKQGGSIANANGRILEDTMIPLFKQHGFDVIQHSVVKRNPSIVEESGAAKANGIEFSIGDAIVLLLDENGLHYELLHVTVSGIVLADPRFHGILYIMPFEARQRILNAEAAWLKRM